MLFRVGRRLLYCQYFIHVCPCCHGRWYYSPYIKVYRIPLKDSNTNSPVNVSTRLNPFVTRLCTNQGTTPRGIFVCSVLKKDGQSFHAFYQYGPILNFLNAAPDVLEGVRWAFFVLDSINYWSSKNHPTRATF